MSDPVSDVRLATFDLPASPDPRGEPVTAGFALARGALRSADGAALRAPGGALLPLQTQALARWPDGSVKWLLCDFLAGPEAGRWEIVRGTPPLPAVPAPIQARLPFGAEIVLTGRRGREHRPLPGHTTVEAAGPVRSTLVTETTLGRLVLFLRITRWADRPEARVELTVRNPAAARHRGGKWDLGDPRSVLVRDLSLRIPVIADDGAVRWRPTPDAPFVAAPSTGWHLFQASSGGERWDCENHVNRRNVVPLAFRGWRALSGESGHRALPELVAGGLRVTVPWFWQEFPKVLAIEDGALRIGLWPREHGDLHELQPGEQKTFVAWLSDGDDPLDFVHAPRRPVQRPDELAATGAVPHLGLPEHDPPEYAAMVNLVVDPKQGFAARRELIDEYGWRNFGDLYADHEAVFHERDGGRGPFVSHYNNQYDCVEAFLLQFLRTGDPRWWALAEPLARHVIDIDLYHTDRDRPVYSGGLFWHTDHYKPARTATHRCYSRRNGGRGYGGGHSNEHNYPSGLLLYHWLTGDPRAAAGVRQLADWVIAMDDGSRTLIGLLDPSPTGHASATYTPDYHGPGRGAGNSVNACCDAFSLTGERRYLDFAESLIRRCVHPAQDLDALDLLDAERRWSYVVFLKYLLKYIELKDERGERDAAYAHARDTLTHYAAWMVAHERPSTSAPERLEFVTETWPAQDLRKAQVVELAAAYVDEATRYRWRSWAERTYEQAFAELVGWETCARCRPLVLMIHPGVSHAWVRAHPDVAVAPHAHDHDFGEPATFVPQRARVKAQLRTFRGILRAVALLLRPEAWRRLRHPW